MMPQVPSWGKPMSNSSIPFCRAQINPGAPNHSWLAPALLMRKTDMLTKGYHQQYLAKNPNGYCGIGGCGVPFKIAELEVGEKA